MKTIKLESGAFNEELLRNIGIGKVGWDSEDHQKLVKAIFPRLRDEEDKNAVLNEVQRNTLELILRPSEDLQSKVLKQTFEAAGYQLDDEAMATYQLLFNGVQFADYLYKTNNPSTNQPYVTKPAPKGKKATLNKLLAQKAAPVRAAESVHVQNDDAPMTAEQSSELPAASSPAEPVGDSTQG